MSKSTQHLRLEHERVFEVLAAFSVYLERARADESSDSREVAGVLEFLIESLLLRHEEKEEEVLLPELANRHDWSAHGLVDKVREEHREARKLMHQMRVQMHGVEDWTKSERGLFLSAAERWASFLRGHMNREEECLFPLIDERLSSEVDATVLATFERIDQDYVGSSDAEMLKKSKDVFVQKYAPAS